MKSLNIKRFTFGLIFLMFIFLPSCIDEYLPELDGKHSNLLVVDGTFTNAPGPQTITLSFASPVSYSHFIPAFGYQVKIKDNHQNEEQLVEIDAGIYSTSGTGIQGIVGRQYKLEITSPSGNQYESDFVRINEPVEIDSVYMQIEYQLNDPETEDQAGFQFYLNTARAEKDTTFFFWRLTETYKYTADYLIRWKFGPHLERVYNADTLFTCWKTEKIHQIFNYNTISLEEPLIEHFPLHYISTNTRHLSIRYSLFIQQYTIDQAVYTFWENVREMQGQQGLYTQQPFQITGNVKCISDPDEVVLGIFYRGGNFRKKDLS